MKFIIEHNCRGHFGYVKAIRVFSGPLELCWMAPDGHTVRPFIQGNYGGDLEEVKRTARRFIFSLEGTLDGPLLDNFFIAGWDYL